MKRKRLSSQLSDSELEKLITPFKIKIQKFGHGNDFKIVIKPLMIKFPLETQSCESSSKQSEKSSATNSLSSSFSFEKFKVEPSFFIDLSNQEEDQIQSKKDKKLKKIRDKEREAKEKRFVISSGSIVIDLSEEGKEEASFDVSKIKSEMSISKNTQNLECMKKNKEIKLKEKKKVRRQRNSVITCQQANNLNLEKLSAPQYPEITFRRTRELQEILILHNLKNKIPSLMKFILQLQVRQSFQIQKFPAIPLSFKSVDNYQQSFSQNIKNQLIYNLKNKIKENSSRIQVTMVSFCRRNQDMFQYKVEAPKAIIESMRQVYSKFRVLLLQKKGHQNGDRTYFSCFVEKSFKILDQKKANMSILLAQQLKETLPLDFYLTDLEKFTTESRQFDALANIKAHKLAPFLANPIDNVKFDRCFMKYERYSELETLLEKKLKQKFNPSQFQAIKNIAYRDGGISLLQGPPGTGKTSTLIGILSCEMMKLSFFLAKAPFLHPRILVCTPSNAAADHITQKIISQKLMDCSQQPLKPKLLRTGIVQNQKIKNISMNDLINWLLSIQNQTQPYLTINNLREQCSILERQLKAHEQKQIEKQIEKQKQKQKHKQKGETILDEYELSGVKMKINMLKKLIRKLSKEKNGETSSRISVRENVTFLEKELFEQSQIVITTLSSSFSERITCFNPTFSCLIVDEAAQATEPSILIPFQYGMSKVVLIGDPKQLPPTVLYEGSMRNNLNRSLFERLISLGAIPQFLDIQYRMTPLICSFPSLYFYGNKLKTSKERQAMEEPRELCWLKRREVFFINCNAKESRIQNSYKNDGEAMLVTELVTGILEKIRNQSVKIDQIQRRIIKIGIITPYSSQEKTVRMNVVKACENAGFPCVRRQGLSFQLELNKFFGSSETISGIQITVSTIDSYQGQERDIIIMSTVRSNKEQKLGFLSDQRRINVALTRAKFMLFVIGNRNTLNGNGQWRQYIEWINRNRCSTPDIANQGLKAYISHILSESI